MVGQGWIIPTISTSDLPLSFSLALCFEKKYSNVFWFLFFSIFIYRAEPKARSPFFVRKSQVVRVLVLSCLRALPKFITFPSVVKSHETFFIDR